MIDDLRKMFTIGTGEKDANGNRVLTDRTYFDGKSVCIVDEISDSGTSLVIAQILFGHAFVGRTKGIHGQAIFETEPPWCTIGNPATTRKEELLGIIDLNPNGLQVSRFPSSANIWLREKIAQTAEETVGRR